MNLPWLNPMSARNASRVMARAGVCLLPAAAYVRQAYESVKIRDLRRIVDAASQDSADYGE